MFNAVSWFIEQVKGIPKQIYHPSIASPFCLAGFIELAQTLVMHHASICRFLSGSEPDNSQQMDAYELG